MPGEPPRAPAPRSPEPGPRSASPSGSSGSGTPAPEEIGQRRGAHRSTATLLVRLRDALADRLPATLRGGTLRPSYRAVLALAGLGVIAVAVGAWFAWQASPSPESTAATTVLQDGEQVRGGAPDPPADGPDEIASDGAASGSPGSTGPDGAGEPVPTPGSSALGSAPPGSLAQQSGPSVPATEVVVHVAGRVLRPGVVRLPPGARVVDAVAAAGGVTAGADAKRINLARPLADGEQVLVLAEGEPAPPGGPPTGPSVGAGASAQRGGDTGLVDLNTATLADLDTLPGVGPVLAQRILDWREANGRFTNVDELREISGVGEKRLADLRGKVTV